MYISIDLGGTNTRIALSSDLFKIDSKVKFPTFSKLEEEKSAIMGTISDMVGSDLSQIEALCIGMPGIVDYKKNTIGKVINVPYLSNINKEELFGNDIKKVLFANDAAIGGLGEAIFGIGKSYETVLYITLSTGVGGVYIQNQKLNTIQKFSEPGHMIIYPAGRKSKLTGQLGAWDAYCSGVSFMEQYNVHPRDCEDKEIWATYGKNVAYGLFNAICLWSPHAVILGGSMSTKHLLFEESMKDTLAQINNGLFELPPVLVSESGHENGLLGGFAFIKQVL